jgi:hypothetical protein
MNRLYIFITLGLLSSASLASSKSNCLNKDFYEENQTRCKISLVQILESLENRTGIEIFGADNHSAFKGAIKVLQILKVRPILAEQIPGMKSIKIQISSGFENEVNAVYSSSITLIIRTLSRKNKIEEFLNKNLYSLTETSNEQWFDMISGIMDEVNSEMEEKVSKSRVLKVETEYDSLANPILDLE